MSENTMKKDELDDDMRPEYDLSTLKNQVRGKYVDRYREGTNIVIQFIFLHGIFAHFVSPLLRLLV